MKEIAKLDLPGYAIGGLAVGEPTEVMYEIIEAVEPYMPKDRPRYLMGVGTPSNIIESVARGVDFFDCVMPARNARHAKLFTWQGSINLKTRSTRVTTAPLIRSASARSVGATPARIFITCSRQRKCSPCACLSCTICIFTIR